MDKLLLYLGDDLVINNQIVIHQPSVIDIARFGERKYFNTVYKMCSIPSNYKSELWDVGINYCNITDFQCFMLLSRDLGVDDTRLLLGDDISFKDMVPYSDSEVSALVDRDKGIIITEEIYQQMIEYIREMHGIHPKRERAANKETLQLLINEDRNKKARSSKDSDEESILLPLISSMVNSPGFKYDINTLKNLGIYPFMDSVQRIQAINTASAISNGMYSGMVDLSQNPQLTNQLNWLRDLSKDKHNTSNVKVTQSKK